MTGFRYSCARMTWSGDVPAPAQSKGQANVDPIPVSKCEQVWAGS
jgi:hypothetical protein